MNRTALKIFFASAALAMTLSLCGCGNKSELVATEPTTEQETAANVPDNVVAPIGGAVTTVSAESEAPPESIGTEAQTSEAETEAQPDETEEPDDEPETEIIEAETEAYRYLDLLNSRKVHASFTQIYSYDGEELMSLEIEYFVNGDERIYVNDGNRTLIRGGEVTYIDIAAGEYYTYPDEGEYGINFGFERDQYKLISTEESDDGYTEVYSIGTGIVTSTWFFGNDGAVRVSDRNLEVGSFEYYTFSAIESDVSGMDFTIPDGFTEVDASEYGMYTD